MLFFYMKNVNISKINGKLILREAFLSIKFKNLFCNTEAAVFKYSTE